MTGGQRVPHALTIDAEDWAALMCMYSGMSAPVSPQFAEGIRRALDLLDEHDSRATFFVVAQHAAEEPAAVREIVARGHELGSHAWTHRLVGSFSPAEFGEDIRRSVRTLEDIAGVKVSGHRSPLFSLLPGHTWALEAMAEAGLEYDSSMATLPWLRAGTPIPEQPFAARLPSGAEVVEFPAPARKVGPITVRFIGGRGVRLAPAGLSIRHLEARERNGLPAMLYVHTYELPPVRLARHLPRSIGLRRMPLALSAFGFQLGMGRLGRLVKSLLSSYNWAPARDVIRVLAQRGPLPAVKLADAGACPSGRSRPG